MPVTLAEMTPRSTTSSAAAAFTALCFATAAMAQTPSNDRCASARDLAQATGLFAFNLTGATTTPSEGQQSPICDQFELGMSIQQDVWFTWTAPQTGVVRIKTATNGSTQELDTKMAVYSGFGCTGPILACDEDTDTSLFSEAQLPVTAGRQLLIQVGMSPDPQTDPSPAFLSIELLGPPPTNDECSAAIDLGSQVGQTGFDLGTATTGTVGQANPPCDDEGYGSTAVVSDIWFKWTAPAPGHYSITTGTSPLTPDEEPDTKLAVYRGLNCPGPVGDVIGCNDDTEGSLLSRVNVQLAAGEHILIQLGRSPFAEDQVTIGELVITGEAGPSNDTCQFATSLGADTGYVPSDTTYAGAGTELAPCLPDVGIGQDVWYVWTAPCTGSASVSTVGLANGMDTVIAVYRGANCNSLIPVACGDDVIVAEDETLTESRVEFPVTAGDSFFLRVGVYPGTPAGSGGFAIECGMTSPCPADFNNDGIIGVQDIFDFLSAWFSGSPTADFNGTGGVTVQDIFDFLTAWFRGPDPCKPECPSYRGLLQSCANSVLLLWNDRSSNELGFSARLRVGSGDWTEAGLTPSNSTGMSIPGLQSDADYTAEVFSFNRYGKSICPASFTFHTDKPIRGIAATPFCKGVQLDWILSVCDEEEVRVAISRDGGQNWDNAASLPPDTESTVIRGLTPNTDYWFRARARTPDGYTIYSDTVHCRTNQDCVMPAPTNCVAARDSSTPALDVVITWTNNAPGATGVRVARSIDRVNWSSIAEVLPTQTSVRDADPALEPNVRYYYHARAVYRGLDGTYYSAYSNTDYAYPVAPNIAPPSNCIADRDSATPETDVVVSWNDNSTNETGFEVERSTDQANWALLQSVGAEITSIRDSAGLAPGTLYYYRVRAALTVGPDTFHSGYSNTDSAFPVTPNIGAPTNCVAARDSTTPELDVVITWNDMSNNETGFEILRSTDQSNWTTAGIVGPNLGVFRDSSCALDPNVTYFYRVRAVLQVGQETFYSGLSSTDNSILPLPSIGAPTIVSADRDRQTPAIDVVVTWIDNATNETEYLIERRPDPGVYAVIASVGANQTTYRDAVGLISGVRYFYRVRGVLRTQCDTFYSGYSASTDANP